MRARLEGHLGSHQVARVTYGAIIGLALIVALGDHQPTGGGMLGWLLATAVAVALAEMYSDVLGIETNERHRVTRLQFGHILEGGTAVAFGIAFPAVFFLLAVLGVLDLETAFAIATWSGLGLIGFYGYWAARFAGATNSRAVLRGVLVALIGEALVLIEALLH